ncbi:uncharacterized protein PHALS_12490 [Plasmopara halstedii]|uniref:Uncharacterized protein n=1 Tax=Plasmopara halstedii TaxID=4781 RepID=A0A0P1ALK3_PLAHL|nr:uncharacterized protein PHALS_12490 [Plasmopara halstedii]CEG42196.1 hypothetical protein PHALS_12490 [Plasmopara halstedii]|eukprot:XP_024578565.1 hypothetical protein PHALS_12490 [Plasmopara halstedii]
MRLDILPNEGSKFDNSVLVSKIQAQAIHLHVSRENALGVALSNSFRSRCKR